MKKFLEKIIGSYSEREIKRLMPKIEEIMALDAEMGKLSDDELKYKTIEFKERLMNGETLDDILVEAFAVVREAASRVLSMKHFKVQLIGGMVLHQGRIAEMKTGEGKTLVATLPVYLNALTGKGVHVITVNDYLAKRDSEWMGKLYRFLGLSVGLIVHGLDSDERRENYACDIVYGTNNEFGFDYLRDNMVSQKVALVQRELNYAIVDEVDSILIDEARTPLIISGTADKSTELYEKANSIVTKLKAKVIVESDDKQIEEDTDDDNDYVVDLKAKTATLNERGARKVEAFFGIDNLSDPENMTYYHHINQALKAHGLFKDERDYVIKDGQVIIVDEFTGRLMFGRRYSDGLHQAIEAKEGVKVQNESKTLATITFQNYFRMYDKLAGMTGTAMTEEEEFQAIYKLDVIEIPTNVAVARQDLTDVVYKTERGKFNAVVEDIIEANKKGQPVLVGTVTIDKSEELSRLLKRQGIKHEVLNAKYHEKEAEIISQAGKFGAVTIATNMAGRGTDITLGGNAEFLAKQEMRKRNIDEALIVEATGFADTKDEEILDARKQYRELYNKYKQEIDVEREKVIAAGGLKVIGTERHESRRIDNQLRGRSGRQGDPGESRFYISLEDDLMKLFGTDRAMGMVDALGLDEETPIEFKILSNSIETAQKRVEGMHFAARKHVLQFDDVMNLQRETIYGQRKTVLYGENVNSNILNMINTVVETIVGTYTGEAHVEEWNLVGMQEKLKECFGEIDIDVTKEDLESIDREELTDKIKTVVLNKYNDIDLTFGELTMRELERGVLLSAVDDKWMDHIDAMEQLKQGIGIRAYGQRDPIVEYKVEGYAMFEEMIYNIQETVVRTLFNIKKDVVERWMINLKMSQVKHMNNIRESRGEDDEKPKTVKKGTQVGRNDLCPCGSGKKYKKCCGMNE